MNFTLIIILAIIITPILIIYKLKNEKNHNNTGGMKNLQDEKWEIVYRDSDKWLELGFGDTDSFPGYGKLYNREFKVWYCDIGSKDKKNETTFQDKFPEHYEPKNSELLTGKGIYLDSLYNTKGFESLYTGLDNKNRKRWYFGLVKLTPTGIETRRALISVEETEEKIEKLIVPENWKLVRRQSKDWDDLGFDENDFFPGYGKIYDRIFDSWYCEIGSKEKIDFKEFKDKAILKHYYGICGTIGDLRNRNIQFESLSKTQGYKQLLTFLDSKNRKRWYFGLKEATPSYIYTAAKE